jgi:hypothetical protein
MSTREILQTGTVANDGTGDTLRDAADKLNTNFVNLWNHIGGQDSDFNSETITVDTAASPTAPISFCNASGALAVSLPDATLDGTAKKFLNINSGTATITPSNTNGSWSNVAITQGRGVEVVWHSTGWIVVGVDGITVS